MKRILEIIKSRRKIELIFNFFLFKINEKVFFNRHSVYKKDNIEIDVVIPTISKDFNTLEKSIRSTKFIMHKVCNIYIVSKTTNELLNFCTRNNVIFIDEESVLGFPKSFINYNFNGVDRSGWLYQQLIKLNSDRISNRENILVLDSDTLFVKPIYFFYENRPILYFGNEWYWQYHYSNFKLIGLKNQINYSFVVHFMIFNSKTLKRLKEEIEIINDSPWYSAIINLIKHKEDMSIFSEYELYSNWCIKNENPILKPVFNKKYNRNETLQSSQTRKFHTISFHSYLADD